MPDFRPIEPAYSVGTNGAIPGRRNAVLAVVGETILPRSRGSFWHNTKEFPAMFIGFDIPF